MNEKKAKQLRRKAKDIARKHNKFSLWENAYKIAKKAYKQGIIIMVLLLMINKCYADTLIIQGDCYPKKIQQAFLERGYKLDLNGIDRDENSWGFIVNEGKTFKIYTYKSVTLDELEIVKEIING